MSLSSDSNGCDEKAPVPFHASKTGDLSHASPFMLFAVSIWEPDQGDILVHQAVHIKNQQLSLVR